MGHGNQETTTERWLYEHNYSPGACQNIAWDGFVLVCLDTGEVLDERPFLHILPKDGIAMPISDVRDGKATEVSRVIGILAKHGISISHDDAKALLKLIRTGGYRIFESTIITAYAAMKGMNKYQYKQLCRKLGIQPRIADFKKLSGLVK
ncbi:MAG: hypothetical protein QW706_09470 [Candidatus Nezhaarchaeales archaeon]